jgi:hypothetical protein
MAALKITAINRSWSISDMALLLSARCSDGLKIRDSRR